MTETTLAAQTPNLNKALSLLQGELPKVTKTKTGKVEGENKAGKYFSYEYSYADLGDVVADVGPLLAKHGLAFHCGPTINPADRREMILIWSLLHESGEERTGEWPLGPVNQKPQSLGSAITYGRRYCFTAATNIVLEDDDDGQRAQQDHGNGSAGGAWDTATTARPANQGQRRQTAAQQSDAAARRRDGRPDKADMSNEERRQAGLMDRQQAAEHERLAAVPHERPAERAHGPDPDDPWAQGGGAEQADGAPETEPGSASNAQLTKLHTIMTGLGFGAQDREQKLNIAETITGHAPLTGPWQGRSSKNLSFLEARKLIDTLDGMSRDELVAQMAVEGGSLEGSSDG